MLMNKAIATAILAALTEQAVAFNAHRHLHNVQKRAVEVEWTTVYETVYETFGAKPSAGSEGQKFVENVKPAEPTSTTTVSLTTTSSSTTTSTLPPPAPTTEEVAAAAVPAPSTTLATSVKPAAPSPKTEKKPTKPKADSKDNSGVLDNVGNNIGDIASGINNAIKPTSTKPSSSKPSGGSSSGGKRGIAYNDASLAGLFKKSCSDCAWAYNWGSSSDGLSSGGLQYIPLLWGDREDFTGSWASNAKEAISNGADAVLSFNEPDHPDQANMDPSSAVAAHTKYMKQFTGQVKVGSPAVTNSQTEGMGVSWLKSFMSECKQTDGCNVDFCAVHWYSPANAADTLYDHIKSASDACDGKPIWLTEFAAQSSDSENADFLKEVLPKLDAMDELEKYSYFMVAQGNLLESLTSLNIIGDAYATSA